VDINDAGSQMDTLARSLYARYMQLWDAAFPFPEEGYPGDYLVPIAEHIRDRDGERWRNAAEADWLTLFATLGRMRSCASSRPWRSFRRRRTTSGKVSGPCTMRARSRPHRASAHLRAHYDKDGALWLRTTESGDNEDRVVVRSDGRPAYFANDVAYHYDKLQRADRVIDILGPDHHG